MESLMSYLQQYVRQVKPRNESYIPPVDKVQNFLYEEGEMNPKELAKYGGKRARVLQKAIEELVVKLQIMVLP